MLAEPIQEALQHWCCPCVNDRGDSLVDDGSFVTYPRKVGGFILLYGRRKSQFPFHCMVGPDWPFVVVVFVLIFVVNIVALYLISYVGWPPVLIGGLGALVLLGSYCSVAFSDPGIIYRDEYISVSTENSLNNPAHEHVGGDVETAASAPAPAPHRVQFSMQRTIECGNCQLQRPTTARHCGYCKVCIDELDHHCPWSGKCIGDKNLKAFYLFTSMICFQFYYLLAALIYAFLYRYGYSALPHGPFF